MGTWPAITGSRHINTVCLPYSKVVHIIWTDKFWFFSLHPLQKQERTGFNFFHLIGGRRKQGVLKISVSYTCANLEDIQARVIAWPDNKIHIQIISLCVQHLFVRTNVHHDMSDMIWVWYLLCVNKNYTWYLAHNSVVSQYQGLVCLPGLKTH